MNRILFTHSYFLRFDPKQWQIMQPYAPLGTIIAAAVVRKAGFRVDLWDPMFAENAAELSPVLSELQPDAVVIYDDGFNYLTKMCLTNMREAAFEMIRMATGRNMPVIVCSSDAADHYEKYLDQGATAVIRGEGEQTLLELLEGLKLGNEKFPQIDGLIYREKDKTVINKAREVIRNLDELPLPAWDLVAMDVYRKAWKNKNGYFSINMSTTRGCPFKCNWCAKPIYGNRYNSRSPEHVVNEINFLVKQYQPDHIWFCDDIFGLKPGWVNRFSALMSEQQLKIRYKIQSRVDLLLQENNIASLALSGCENVWVGAESGSQTILDAMDKGTRVEQIFEATRLLKKYAIRPAFFLQFGYPGETREDIDKTIEMVKTLLPDDIGISVSYPLPGTPFYEKVKSELQVKTNWSDSDELALMFTNTFPAQFYKHLHRYVHKTYRIHQGKNTFKELLKGKPAFKYTPWKRVAGIVLHQPGAWYHQHQMNKYPATSAKLKTISQNNDTVKMAFDHAATEYDEGFTETITGKLQRNAVHRFLKHEIDPAMYRRVLELNCGTGEDAIWMAKQGFEVLATDISPEMVQVARQKAGLSKLHHPPEFRTMSFNEIHLEDDYQFDFVFSNFGGLNCAEPGQLRQLGSKVSKILRPGGKFVAVVMGRKCLIENVYFSIKNPGKRNRRKSKQPVPANLSAFSFPVWYYSPDEFSELFRPWLDTNVSRPVGLFIPPSWMNHHFAGSGALKTGAGILERITSNIEALSDYADHYIIEFTNR